MPNSFRNRSRYERAYGIRHLKSVVLDTVLKQVADVATDKVKISTLLHKYATATPAHEDMPLTRLNATNSDLDFYCLN